MSYRAFETEDAITCATCTDSLDIEHGAFRITDDELDGDERCQRCGISILGRERRDFLPAVAGQCSQPHYF